MNGISPWAVAAKTALSDNELPKIFENQLGGFQFKVQLTADSLWVRCSTKSGEVAFRTVYSPDGMLGLTRKQITKDGINIFLSSAVGKFKTIIRFTIGDYPVLRYTTELVPSQNLLFPFWPRDIIFPGNKSDQPQGEVHVSQVGTRSGLLHFSMKKPSLGSILYLQNLTNLVVYNQQTETSAGGTVGGTWPEIGFALPVSNDKPILKGKAVTLTDAIVAFDQEIAKDENALTRQYLNMLAEVYLLLPRPDTQYIHWPNILQKGLHDLTESPGCWSQVAGKHYFNAYISDYETPPEIMVQLAVLLPLLDYVEWSGETMEVMEKIREGLPAFWDEKLKTVVRWLPAAAEKLKGEEEQKKPMVMDSWYLHHPLLNLSRLALKGDGIAIDLFLKSLPYATKVAKHFKYRWPVFYKMDTLEVVKAETKPGEGGQHDVAGLYTHIMLQAYELTKAEKYLREAETAAKTLKGYGFKLFYQANNTAFSAGALLRLHKLTKKKLYLSLSELCMANIFQNMQLWDCNYGYGKHFPSFFALFPLSDAPYTAVYEEQEVFCAMHDYLQHADGVEVLPAIKLLCSEYIRNLINRACYYYPPMLPAEMLSEEVKVGEVDQKIWVALEDMHDGWEKSGEVGQEVYGAGNAFGIVPRHYLKIKDRDFMIYADYPIAKTRLSKNDITFHLQGDARIVCRLRIIPLEGSLQADFRLTAEEKQIKGNSTSEGHVEFELSGDQQLKLTWQTIKTQHSTTK